MLIPTVLTIEIRWKRKWRGRKGIGRKEKQGRDKTPKAGKKNREEIRVRDDHVQTSIRA